MRPSLFGSGEEQAMATTEPIIPANLRDVLDDPNIGHLATVRTDGSPQCNPVWFAWDGRYLKVSLTPKRQKYRNMRRNPNVSLSVVAAGNPNRYLEVRGRVQRIDVDEGNAFVDSLARRYMGTPFQWHQPGDERLVVWIQLTASSFQDVPAEGLPPGTVWEE
jgi:PPOX class probable F420-dependent enzyme